MLEVKTVIAERTLELRPQGQCPNENQGKTKGRFEDEWNGAATYDDPRKKP
jgi:hypothetical protein